ncbi:Hypothetical predicted protein [Olea europaea subsp. europaea]|uniref:Transmembrane protein n=1 Tax=Olea europaea subsp. europaea TaxID=158383 RepID=A0A8S0V4H3_OLEEU|nr:Hypothetical predicted protein [Olea europaea subsp. europaea]
MVDLVVADLDVVVMVVDMAVVVWWWYRWFDGCETLVLAVGVAVVMTMVVTVAMPVVWCLRVAIVVAV